MSKQAKGLIEATAARRAAGSNDSIRIPSPPALTQNKAYCVTFDSQALSWREQTLVAWGKVRLTWCSETRSHWFNDLSAAGEWSRCNILRWLVNPPPTDPVPPRGLTDMILVGPAARGKASRTSSYWHDPGSCPRAQCDPKLDLSSQTRRGRRITCWGELRGRDGG